MEYKKRFFDFLESEKNNLKLEIDNNIYTFVKVPYNETVDLIYSPFYHRPIIPSDKLEYVGFYDKVNKQLYDPQNVIRKYILKLDWEDVTYKTMRMLLSEFNDKINDIINDYVEMVRDDFYEYAGEYHSDLTMKDVLHYYIEGKEKLIYNEQYNMAMITDVLDYINKDLDDINLFVLDYVNVEKNAIGRKLIDIDKTNQLLSEIREDKELPIHKIKQIKDIIEDGEYGKVHVFIKKDDIEFDFKYDASSLSSYWSYNYLPQYAMSKTDQMDFEKLFGKYKDFDYKDIVKIEYRNKVIYEDIKFSREIDNQEEMVL